MVPWGTRVQLVHGLTAPETSRPQLPGRLLPEDSRARLHYFHPTVVAHIERWATGVIFLWLLLGIVMWLVLQRTAYGRRVFAVGTNRTTSRLSGVRVASVVVMTYALSGMLAALGGVVLLGYTEQVFLNLGDPYTLPSVAAVVVGGTLLAGGVGSYFGTMAGALVLTLLTSLLIALDLPESIRLIVYGATLLLLLSLYGRQKALRQ